jgi:hypothetical protein
MTSTSKQVRLTSAVAAFAAAASLFVAVSAMFNAPVSTAPVIELAQVVVTPKAAAPAATVAATTTATATY